MFVNRAYYLVRDNAQMFIELDRTAMEREIAAFKPPPMPILDAVRAVPAAACCAEFWLEYYKAM